MTLAGPASAVAADAAAPTAPSAACQISELPLPEGTWRSWATGGDPTGRQLLGSAWVDKDGTRTSVPLRWVDGTLAAVPSLSGTTTLVDANASGAVAGYTSDGGKVDAWVYRAGRLTELPGLRAGQLAYPTAMNARGDVVGYVQETVDGWPVDVASVYWPADRPAGVRTLPLPKGVHPSDLDEDGTVVATIFTDISHSYLVSPRGVLRNLHGPSGAPDFSAKTLRNGWVSGTERSAGTGNATVVAWNLRTGAVLKAPDQASLSTANGRGDLSIAPQAILHRDGRLVALPGLNGGPTHGTSLLSDHGLAAGWARDGDRIAAVVWNGC